MVVTFRADPALVAEMRAHTSKLAQTLEDAMRLWLAREKRKAAKPDLPAKHLAPPATREFTAQRKRENA